MQKPSEGFAAFVGIDWADRKHDLCLEPAGAARERGVLEHRPAAIEAGARSLKERFGGAPVAVAVELSRGPTCPRNSSTTSSSSSRSTRRCSRSTEGRSPRAAPRMTHRRRAPAGAAHAAPREGPCAEA